RFELEKGGLAAPSYLDIVIEVKLVRVRAEGDGIDLALALVADPLIEDVLREDATAEEEFVVGLEGVEHFGEAAGGALDLRTTLGSGMREHLVQVLVDGIWWTDLVDHSIESSHQHR